MFVRLLAESLRRGRRRKLVAASAIALGIAGASALGAVLLQAGDEVNAQLSAYGANLSLAAASENATLPLSALDALGKIFWRHNLKAVAPLLPLRVAAGDQVVPLVGTWFDRDFADGLRGGLPRVRPTLPVSGRWPAEGAPEAALGRRLAARLGIGTGDELRAELDGRSATLRVVGIVGGGGEEEDQILAPLEAANALAGGSDRFLRAEISALTVPERAGLQRDPARMTAEEYDAWYCTAFPSAIAHQVEQAVAGGRAQVVRQTSGAAAEVMGRLRSVLLLLAAAVIAGTVVGATAAMASTVVERRLEVGLLRALGAERRAVSLFFLSEAALLGSVAGALGGVVGLLAGRALARLVFGAAGAWSWPLLPFAVLLGLSIAVLGSAAPVWRALRESPARELKRAVA
jgi:putative ABC transport system permease protein